MTTSISARLIDVISRENEALLNHNIGDIEKFTKIKIQILFELSKIRKADPNFKFDEASSKILDDILEKNTNILQMQIAASEEISNSISKAYLDLNCDGLYKDPSVGFKAT